MRARRTILALALCLFAALPADARERDVRFRLTDAGNAAAAPGVLRLADLDGAGIGSAWDGGKVKPDQLTDPGCPGVDMPVPSGTVTGLAKSDFANGGYELTAETQVFAQPAMAAGWQRDEASGQRGLACVRDSVAHAKPPVTVLAAVRVRLAGLGRMADAFRIEITDSPNPGHPQVIYIVDVVRGRTQVGLIAVGRAPTTQRLGTAVGIVMRKMLARARA